MYIVVYVYIGAGTEREGGKRDFQNSCSGKRKIGKLSSLREREIDKYSLFRLREKINITLSEIQRRKEVT